jgi:phosphatidylserine/phosphatidylglycerophosphate/cardiolipin synthase-like enzyme
MVCPWIDEYFAEEVCKASIAELSEVKVLMRPESAVEIEVWPHMLAAVRRIKERFPSAQVRTLERLHAKVIVLDDAVAFIGSTNLYRFSLQHSHELGVRGPITEMGNLAAEVMHLFDEADPLEVEPGSVQDSSGIQKEVLDPIVQEILERNPGAWVVGRRPLRTRKCDDAAKT